jgi:hypothetical protein
MKPQIEQLTLGGGPTPWREAGFNVGADGMRAGSVRLEFAPGQGILGWRLAAAAGEIDGLPVARAAAEDRAPGGAHPNGVTQIDHLVVFSPDLERTTAAFGDAGIERRRVREIETEDGPLRQGFFRLGEVILEVAEDSRVEPGPARFWGITFAVADLDACAELLGERLGSVRDAVQPGRRIATVREGAGLGLPVALISASGR